MQKWKHPITLKANGIQLIPLAKDQANDLAQAATEGTLWKLWFTSVPHPDKIEEYIEEALTIQKAGDAIPFAIWEEASQQFIGATRFCNIDRKNRRLEIGYTWYAKSFQRTHVNTNVKLLLLSYAFEQLNAIAVEFRTNWHNHASRNAILRLGAKQDGVLRNHRIDAAGVMRDTVVFSIIASEWPAVKQHLQFKLDYYA